MPNRAQDWLAQAERDMRLAAEARQGGFHEWACFAAHQAAEKAVKALHLAYGQEAWGHTVATLLSSLPLEVPAGLVDRGKVLDNFYIPTRYANGHASGAPFEHYGAIQSEDALRYAGEILEFVRAAMAGPQDRGPGGEGVGGPGGAEAP